MKSGIRPFCFIVILIFTALMAVGCAPIGIQTNMGQPPGQRANNEYPAPATKVVSLVKVTPCATTEGEDTGICPIDLGYPVSSDADYPAPGGMPPRTEGEGGSFVVNQEDLPFTFELPDHWVTSAQGDNPEWTPAGVTAENSPGMLGVRIATIEKGQDLETVVLQGVTATVRDRAVITVMGQDAWQYQVEACEGEGCGTKVYATLVIWKTPENVVYWLYTESPTPEDRTSLQPILDRAVETLTMKEPQ